MRTDMDFEDIGGGFDVKSFVSYARARSSELGERDPVVGDTVHHWDGEACRAAIVTQDDLDTVRLTAFLADGPHAMTRHVGVAHDESKTRDTWHWPEAE